MTTSLAIGFNDLQVTTSLNKLYNVVGDLLDVSTRKNPLYFVNHFQYKHGNLFRAILGKLLLWDEKVEDQFVDQLDKDYHQLIDNNRYSLECYKSKIAWPVVIQGILWVNDVKPKNLQRGQRRTRLRVPSGSYIYVRVSEDGVDVEGIDWQTSKVAVISIEWDQWNKIKANFEISGNKKYDRARKAKPL